LVTPYGWGLYGVVYEYATQSAPWHYLRELRAPDFRSPLDWIVLVMAMGAAFALGARRETRPFPVLLLLACSFLSFRAMRDSWCLTVVAAAICAQALPREAVAGRLLDVGRAAACTVIVVAVLSFAYGARGISERSLSLAVADKFPMRATEFVRAGGYEGPLYNHFDWGGYLIWNLPGLPVSMDGRTNVYGDELIVRSMQTWSGAPGWKENPELVGANLVIAPKATTLASLLGSDRRFETVFEDELSVVFVRAARTASSNAASAGRDGLL
jgi:hypothetical protein